MPVPAQGAVCRRILRGSEDCRHGVYGASWGLCRIARRMRRGLRRADGNSRVLRAGNLGVRVLHTAGRAALLTCKPGRKPANFPQIKKKDGRSRHKNACKNKKSTPSAWFFRFFSARWGSHGRCRRSCHPDRAGFDCPSCSLSASFLLSSYGFIVTEKRWKNKW